MQKQLNISENYMRKADFGKPHRRWAWGGVPIGMYDRAGALEKEFADIYDAVENSGVDGVTYKGISSCCEGRIRTHAKKIWRKDGGGAAPSASRAEAHPCTNYSPSVCGGCDMFDTRCPGYAGEEGGKAE